MERQGCLSLEAGRIVVGALESKLTLETVSDMLHFSRRPDTFFRILVQEAVSHTLKTCLRFDDAWLSKAGQYYPTVARAQIHALTTALTEPPLYQLTEYHWFL